MVGTGRGAQLGVLIKGPEVLEQTRRATTIVLDKTGTVTEGKLRLADVVPLNGATRADVLRLAGAVEDASEHPVARAVAAAARAELGGLAGRERRSATSRARASSAPSRGRRFASTARASTGAASCARGSSSRTPCKPTSAEAIRELRALGLEPVLLTGDAEETRTPRRGRGRHRARRRRGAARREGGGGSPSAGRRRGRRDGRRRRQRRTGARAGGSRDRDRHRAPTWRSRRPT